MSLQPPASEASRRSDRAGRQEPPTAPARFPLLARILVWFFLNLTMLAAVGFLLVRSEFRLEALMTGRGGERMQRLADALLAELRLRPRTEWQDIVQRFSDAYGIRLLLFAQPDEQIAGELTVLPPEVRARLPRRGPLFGRAAPLQPPLGPALEPALGGPNPPAPGRPGGPRFLVHTKWPDRYWIIFPGVLPEGPGTRGPRAQPLSLIAVSDTLSAGGLLFDATPWLWAGGAVLALSVLWWLPFVRGITRAVSQMTRATERIAEGRFDARAPERRRDELGRLGAAINRLAERLAGFVAGQKRFLGDVAHELCSPLARIQVALGILEQRADPAQRPYVEDLREEVQQMSELVNELLSFSKASLATPQVRREAVALREVVEAAVRREKPEPGQVEVRVPDGLLVEAEGELLRRAVANLLRNAVRYAGAAGPIQVSAETQGDQVLLTVADHGPGVPEAELQKVFDPFYRLDSSRDRATGGVGLGLAIVKTCVEACGGVVTCRNRAPHGLEVVIRLPAAASPPLAARAEGAWPGTPGSTEARPGP